VLHATNLEVELRHVFLGEEVQGHESRIYNPFVLIKLVTRFGVVVDLTLAVDEGEPHRLAHTVLLGLGVGDEHPLSRIFRLHRRRSTGGVAAELGDSSMYCLRRALKGLRTGETVCDLAHSICLGLLDTVDRFEV
jgi:hypothetical protein